MNRRKESRPASSLSPMNCRIVALRGTSALVLLLTVAAPARGGEYERFLREGNELYARGDYARAEEQYIKSREEKQDSAIARFNIGNTYFARQDYERAIEHYLEALNWVRADRELETRVRYNLATARVRESERSIGDVTSPQKVQTGLELLRQAITTYRDVLEIDPDHADARHNLAVCQLRIKQLLDTLKRLREEAAKQQEEEGKSPVEILRELIAEEEEEIGLTRAAAGAVAERERLAGQRQRIATAHRKAELLGDDPTATAARQGLLAELAEIEADPAIVIGGAEVSRARKELEAGESAGPGLADATRRLDAATGELDTRVVETLETDREKQTATRDKAAGLVAGIRQRLEGAQGATVVPPPGQAQQPPGPPAPGSEPLPAEVAEILEKVSEHTQQAAFLMDGVLQLFGPPDDQQPTPVGAIPGIISGQEGALEALRKALEEAEKLPRDEQQQQQQQNNQQQQNDQQQSDQQQEQDDDKPKDEQQGENEDRESEQGQDQQAKQEQQSREQEQQLSEEEAEELLRRFLRREREREKDRKQRRVIQGGGRRIDKDW